MKICLAILLCAFSANAADKYYRQGAGGAANGNNWTDAYTSWATAYGAVNRGDTLWVADTSTSIGSIDMNKAASGTTLLTIRKATVANHGTSTGWSDAFGDGQAVFGSIDINTPYHFIDGQTRTETTRMEQPAGYGFRADVIYASGFSGQHDATGCQFSYMQVGGPWDESNTPNCNAPSYSLYMTLQQSVTFTRCVFHNTGVNNGAIAMMHGANNATFDHCDFYFGWGKATIAAPNIGINNLTVRYCRFWDSSRSDPCPATEGEGITCEIGSYSTGAGSTHNDNLVYGSTFFGTASDGRNASVQWGDNSPTGGTAVNCKVFNNTFVGFPESPLLGVLVLMVSGNGNEGRNNLFYNTSGNSGVSANSVSGNVLASSNPFVDYNARDFRLAQAVAGATSLSAPYNTDPDGNTRGGDGTWDVGAYEFGGVQSAPNILNTGTYLWTNGIAGTVLISVDGGATSYGATNLPAGLSVSGASGNITGTPTDTVTNTVGLFATNSAGFDVQTVTFSVLPAAPVLAILGGGGFGLIPTNTTLDATFVVSNAGPSGTTLSGSVSNVIGTPFSLQTAPATYSLASGAAKTYTLRYAPTAVGTNHGSAAVNGNHASNFVSLSGMAFPVFTGTNWIMTNALVLAPMVKHADNYITTTQTFSGTPTSLSGLAIFGYNRASQTTGSFWGSMIATNVTGGSSITFDAASSEHVENAATGETTPHTQGTLTDGYIVASVGLWSSGDFTITAASYDGSAMQLLAEHNLDYYGEYRVQIYGLPVANKTSGTYNFAITASGTLGHYNAGIVSLSNVRQTGSFGTAVDGVGTNTTASLTVSSAAGELVFLAVVRGNVAGAPDSGETERVDTQPEADGESQFPDTLWVGTEPGAASVNIAVDFTGSSTYCATAIPIRASTNFGLNSILFGVNAMPFSTNLWPVIPKMTNFTGRTYAHLLGTGTVTAPMNFTNQFVLGTSNVFFVQTVESDLKLRELNFEESGAAAVDSTDPVVTITTPTDQPTHSQESAAINIGGTASDNVILSSVTASMTGDTTGSIPIEGLASWGGSTTINLGVTVISVTATDSSGNVATAVLTVTRTSPAGITATVTNLTVGTLNAQ